LNNGSHDITALQSFGNQWRAIANENVNISESMMGQNPPSGTAWRQTQAILQESHSLFETMTENKGLAIEAMLREHIIPYLKTKMDTTDEISGILEKYQIEKIDSMFIPAEATRRVNNRIIEDILNKTPEDIANGNLYTPEQQQAEMAAEQQNVKAGLEQMGNQRFIAPSEIPSKTWKQVMKNFEWNVDVDVTGEGKDREAALTTLNTVFQTIAGMQGRPMTDEEKYVFNQILETVGTLSAVELPAKTAAPAPQPAL